MNIHSLVEQIIPTACPSIQYRIRKEIFKESPDLAGMREVQDQILIDGSVRKVTASQGPDGWLAWNFHGYESMESGIRLLCEKGVETDNPVLARAVIALENGTDRLERGLGSPGKILDDLGFGGGETIRAFLFALTGKEECVFVKDQVQQALDVFRFSTQVKSLKDIHEKYKGLLVFRPNVCWPSIYHLRLLAWTRHWRTSTNQKMMVKSIQNLVRLSPIPDIYLKYKTQIVAPASFCMHHFAPHMNQLSDAEWMQWFHRMELLARLGVIHQIPELEQQVRALENLLLENHGLFTKNGAPIPGWHWKKTGAAPGAESMI